MIGVSGNSIGYVAGSVPWVYGSKYGGISNTGTAALSANSLSWAENENGSCTLSWYTQTNQVEYQLNTKGNTYHYIIIL